MNIFLCRKDFFYLVTFVTIQFFPAFWSQAAKAPASKQQLESIATHIVVGNVQAVYSYKEREGIPLVSGYEYDHKVAEVKIEKVEKGEISESLVYVRYWSRTWKGIGLPPPGGQSYKTSRKRIRLAGFIWQKIPTTACRRKITKTGDTMSFMLTVFSQSKNKDIDQVA
jgi:hypothetical protein